MAKDDKRQTAKDRSELRKKNANIKTIADFLKSNGDRIKRTVTYSDSSNEFDLELSQKSMEDVLDKLLDGVNTETNGSSGVFASTGIMNRMKANGTDEAELIQLQKDLNSLMAYSANDVTMLSGMTNDDIIEHDLRIDTVLHYCSKLDAALDAKADCILSADHFDKSFINVVSNTSSIDPEVFSAKSDQLLEMYQFETKADEWYREAAKYGEKFVYCIPYEKGVARLLRTRDTTNNIVVGDINSNGIVSESLNVTFDTEESRILENFGGFEVEINKTGLIVDAVTEAQSIHECAALNESLSVVNEDIDQVSFITNKANAGSWDRTVPGEIDAKAFRKAAGLNNKTKNGLIAIDGSTPNEKLPEVSVPGAIIRPLPRKNVFPRYINDTCLGYTYVEILNSSKSENNRIRNFKTTINPINTMNGYTQNHPDTKRESPDEKAIKYMAKRLAQFIDVNFVNNNQDITNDIYNILKYTDDLNCKKKVRVTFIPPSDMIHIFFKQDPVTHRGISDIENSILPATLYASMFITNAIWNLTRGADKRVYYVKQTIDTNTSQVMMNTIEQIKKGNMGIRQVENIQHILNITGRFNDYLIPTSPSGEEPLRMEVLPGQQIELQNELMNTLLEAAITPTGVPMEYIDQRRSVEFATQLTMSNNKFLMDTYKRQSQYQKILTRTFSTLYQYQFNEKASLSVKLPPPSFLNITNVNQIMMNISDMTSKLVELLGVGYDEQVLQYVNKKLTIKYLGSYLDLDEIERIMKESEQEFRIKDVKTIQQAAAGGGEEY